MSLTIHRDLSVCDYVNILEDIEQGCATLEQWAQLSDNMVFALPWRLVLQCPEGLAAAKAELAERLVEEREAIPNKDSQDQGIHWDDEHDWSFTSLAGSDPKEPSKDGELQCDGNRRL